MNNIIQSNLEMINQYKKLIEKNKGTFFKNQNGFKRFEIKKLLLENYELAQKDIENERITSFKGKSIVILPKENKEQIWDLSSKEIWKYRNKEDVDMERLEELSLDYIK